MDDLDTLVQGKIDEDTEFQSSIKDLSDDEKSAKLNEKRSEVLKSTFGELKEKADKAAKAEELANNYKTRAEKAEAEAKKYRKGTTETQTDKDSDLSQKDLYALMNAKVHSDDLDWLSKQAKIEGKPVIDLLKSDEVQAVLKLRTEKRATADAANTKKARPAGQKPDPRSLVNELVKEGKFPEAGSDEAEELFYARRGGRKS